MVLVPGRIFAVILLLPLCAFAAPKKKVPATKSLCVPASSALVTGRDYATVLQDLGVAYVMARVAPETLRDLSVALAATGGVDKGYRLDAVTYGKVNPQGLGHNLSLVPLLHRDSLRKWIAPLMSNGDSIYMGQRHRSTLDWKVGLVFPTSIFNDHPFKLAYDSRMVSGSGLANPAFDSKAADASSARFKEALGKLLDAPTYPDSTDAHSDIYFEFAEGLPMRRLDLLWIPAPLLDWISQYPKEFASITSGLDRYKLPNPYGNKHDNSDKRSSNGRMGQNPRSSAPRRREVFPRPQAGHLVHGHAELAAGPGIKALRASRAVATFRPPPRPPLTLPGRSLV